MNANKSAAIDAEKKRQEAEKREVIGAAWYQFEHAVQGMVPGKPYYLLPEAEREDLRARGEALGKTLVRAK
jgi:phage gp29-like protein